jgi:putative membrane protein
MNRFLLRWLINAVGLFVAIKIVPGIEAQSENWLSILVLALIFGVINALLNPLLKLLTCPLIILTLGLFTIVINTVLFWLAGRVGEMFGVGFYVDGWLPALLGSLVVSFISIILSLVFKDELKRRD